MLATGDIPTTHRSEIGGEDDQSSSIAVFGHQSISRSPAASQASPIGGVVVCYYARICEESAGGFPSESSRVGWHLGDGRGSH